jgi:hypothetical protein
MTHSKSKFLGFINRYFLAGNTESAKLVIKKNELSTNFMSTDSNVIGNVVLKKFENKDAELAVYNTAQLVKLTGAVDEKLQINIGEVDNKAYNIVMKDSNTSVTYMLADAVVIRKVPVLTTLPEFDVKIEINKEFSNAFKKAANALSESDNFGVSSDGSETKITINHSSVNTNRVVFSAKAIEQKQIDIQCFSSKIFKEILNANADVTGFLEVSSKGLGRVTFENDEFSAVYYLIKLSVS